jgi:hypothetical protein
MFPLSENSWIDVGQWSEYKENLEKLSFNNWVKNSNIY